MTDVKAGLWLVDLRTYVTAVTPDLSCLLENPEQVWTIRLENTVTRDSRSGLQT